jgi:hypothetical protein
MRAWVYNRIKAITSIPTAFGEAANMRILSSGSGNENPVKPFLLVSFGVEQPPLGSVAEMRVQAIPFTVWVHDAPGSMLNIDDAAVALKNNLPTPDGQRVGGMSLYNLEWVETGEDAYDDFFGTNTRPVRFTMMTRRAG